MINQSLQAFLYKILKREFIKIDKFKLLWRNDIIPLKLKKIEVTSICIQKKKYKNPKRIPKIGKKSYVCNLKSKNEGIRGRFAGASCQSNKDPHYGLKTDIYGKNYALENVLLLEREKKRKMNSIKFKIQNILTLLCPINLGVVLLAPL